MRMELSKSDYEIWVLTLWMLWNEICQIKRSIQMESRSLIDTNITRVVSFLYEFQKAKANLAPNLCLGIGLGIEDGFLPVLVLILRLDVDAMFHALNRKFGVGVVLRNHLGIIVAASSKQIPQAANCSIEAEIPTVLQGISLCIQLRVGL